MRRSTLCLKLFTSCCHLDSSSSIGQFTMHLTRSSEAIGKRLRCCEFKKCGKIHLVKLQAYSFNFSTSRILQIFSEHFSTRTVQNRSFWSTKTLAVSLKLIAVLGTFYITEGKGFRNKPIYKLFAWFKLLWLKIKKYRCNIGIILKMFALIIPLVFFRLLKL